MENCSVVDLFCGVGGLTHGFVAEGFSVVAGFDADKSCRYAYETNNRGARFFHRKIEDVTAEEIIELYPKDHVKVLVGCAPCQPYSTYTNQVRDKDDKWKLLDQFADLICEVDPEIVSMENVPNLVTFQEGAVYDAFVERLEEEGYHVKAYPDVYCPDYGVPQRRTRLVFFGSKHGEVEIAPKTHSPDQYVTVRQTIGGNELERLEAGQASEEDPVHKASSLSDLNLRRIRASVPGGTWRDWPEDLRAECHKKETGKWYNNVYGRMEWDDLAPTVTTQCYGFGNGRFGHPEQDRAISLREAALLQSFPPEYEFVEPGRPVYFKFVARYVGNAVPVELAKAIAMSVRHHLHA